MSSNFSNFTTVFDDNFSNDRSLNWGLWGARWGNSDQFSFGNGALTLTSSASENWNAVGFLQQPTGKSAGEGYGLFQFTGYGNAGQGTGICFEMWRADNVWLDSSKPNAATEMDLLETQGGRAFSTIHWYDSSWSSNDGQASTTLNIDVSKSHTYAMDWERGSLTYYVDGQEIYRDTTHAPLDAADGGSNEVMGAQVVNAQYGPTTPSVQLHITDMSYSAPNSNAAPAPSPTPNPTPAPAPSPTPDPTPAPTGNTQIGASASGPLAFQVEQSSSNALSLDVQKAVGATATMREFLDNHYVGTVIDNMKDGSVSGIAVGNLSAGSHTITLTLDGNSNSATASFTVSAAQTNSTSTAPVFISSSHASATLASGQTLNDTGTQNTITLPVAGGVTLNGATLDNADSFDLRAAMATTNWDGKSADLGAYLTGAATNGGKDLQVLLHPQGGSASSLLATVTSAGQDTNALLRFEQHAVLH